MALVKCKECGHEISDQAMLCPNCGAKKMDAVGVSSPDGMKVLGGFLILIGLVFEIYGTEQRHLGLFCFALGAYFLMKKWNQKVDEKTEETEDNKEYFCTDCKKNVPKDANKCPHCGAKFD
jgi:DNA-directed RNA polymerase subunit RPC12/RpoP